VFSGQILVGINMENIEKVRGNMPYSKICILLLNFLNSNLKIGLQFLIYANF
jgi:hypothetical protein